MMINNKLACASKAGYGGDGSVTKVNGKDYAAISSMSNCAGPIPVKKGDVMQLVVQYDLLKHPLRESASGHHASGVMGMMAMTFAGNK